MTELTRLQQAHVFRGRLVRPGDTVNLLTLEAKKEVDGDRYDEYSAMNWLADTQRWLGPEPFVISWIGQWPCGHVMLYLRTAGGENSGEPGCSAYNFM